MNYSIIFCLIFTLVSSKLEVKHYKSFIQNAKDILADDSESCKSQTTKNNCIAQKISDPEMECCYITAEMKYNEKEESQKICEAIPKQIGEFEEIIELKQTNELVKEVYGYVIMNIDDIEEEMPEDFSATANIKCKKTDIDVKFDYSLTEEDKKVLKSENHCFDPLVKSIAEGNISSIDDNVKCEKMLLRQDSLKAGIECGYIKVEGKMDEETRSLKTCFPFHYDLYKKITKLKIMDVAREKIKETGFEGNIRVEFYNSKGKKVTFDTDNSMLLKSNLLLLLLIFLFMF